MRTYSWLVIVMSLSVAGCTTMRTGGGLSQDASDMRFRYKKSYTHVDGTRLVAADGHEVQMHGINIGGWLVTEAWMCGFTDSSDMQEDGKTMGAPGRSTLTSLEERFGREDAANLIRAWEDHWITTRDLDLIRNAGFNVVRVPISYRTLQHADGTWIVNARGEIDYSRMDWIVREAAKRGIYTIFDLHVWPEQREAYEKIGRPEGEAIRQSMARLWTAVAAHYRGNGAIAAFDLINEFPGQWGVQKVLSRAVRQGDPDRVLIVEGYTFEEFLKLHDAGEFPNSVFSEHLYAAEPLSTEEVKTRLKDTTASPVPVYIGEFLAADFAATTEIMNGLKVSWSPWTYKAVDMGQWSLLSYTTKLKIDIQHDSFQDIMAKWSTELTAWQTPGADPNLFINENRRFAKVAGPSTPLAE
jgi:endoglucanase